jgi:AraC-like DNA-binding protein
MSFIFEERYLDSPFVEKIWRTESERSSAFSSVAVSRWDMVFVRHNGTTRLTLWGPETKATSTESPANAEVLGVRLKLGTYMPYLPIKNLVNEKLTLPNASITAVWLNGSAWSFPRYEEVDTFVDRLERESLLARDPVVDAVLQGHTQDVSPRTLQHRFLQATGLCQRKLLQIERARRATALLIGGTSIADVVYKMGYADQAHLTNALKHLRGQTPTQLAGITTAL